MKRSFTGPWPTVLPAAKVSRTRRALSKALPLVSLGNTAGVAMTGVAVGATYTLLLRDGWIVSSLDDSAQTPPID